MSSELIECPNCHAMIQPEDSEIQCSVCFAIGCCNCIDSSEGYECRDIDACFKRAYGAIMSEGEKE